VERIAGRAPKKALYNFFWPRHYWFENIVLVFPFSSDYYPATNKAFFMGWNSNTMKKNTITAQVQISHSFARTKPDHHV